MVYLQRQLMETEIRMFTKRHSATFYVWKGIRLLL